MTLSVRATIASLSLAIATSFGATALADAASEEYVRINSNAALESLNNPTLNGLERREAFQSLMNRFTDIDRVSNFVIGKYARRFSGAELEAYRAAFREYALATYEGELDQYRGNEIVVSGSIDRNDYDSIVETVVQRGGQELPVKWRVLKDRDAQPGEEAYTVVDVALVIEGNLIWLAIEQRAQFLAILDRSNGDAATLIEKINEMTERLNARAAERRAEMEVTTERVEVTSADDAVEQDG